MEFKKLAMKIAIVCQLEKKHLQGKLTGGIMSVEVQQARLLGDAGHQVIMIGSADSEDATQHPQVFWDNVSLCCEEHYEGDVGLTKAEKGRYNKLRKADIRDIVYAHAPDVIINHSFSSSHVKLMVELADKFPVLNFLHNTPDTAMDIAVIAKVQAYQELVRKGSKNVCVSAFQRDLWRAALRKRLTNGDSFNFLTEESIDQIYDGVCYSAFVKPAPLLPAEKKFTVISRIEAIKNLHRLYELMLFCEPFELHTFVAHKGDLSSDEYYAKKIKPPLEKLLAKGFKIVQHVNAPREELLECLGTSCGSFIPCPVESASLALVEAAAAGVRSIVFGKKRDGALTHAAITMLGMHNIELLDSGEADSVAGAQLQAAVKKLLAEGQDPLKRAQLAKETMDLHSLACRLRELEGLLQEVTKAKPKVQPLFEF
jgi:hypothetical protein